MPTITSANSAFSLAVTDLYPAPQAIQGYAADDAFSAEAIELAEIVMGVDGHMSGGFIFNPSLLKVAIMPDSPSLPISNSMGRVYWSIPTQLTYAMRIMSRTKAT